MLMGEEGEEKKLLAFLVCNATSRINSESTRSELGTNVNWEGGG